MGLTRLSRSDAASYMLSAKQMRILRMRHIHLRRGDVAAFVLAAALLALTAWASIGRVGSASWPSEPFAPVKDWRCQLPGYSDPICKIDYERTK